jgi:hypothetical protein
MCGTAAANRRQEEDMAAAAIVASMAASKKRKWGGSVLGHDVKQRERDAVHEQIMRNYFYDSPLYGEEHFRRR